MLVALKDLNIKTLLVPLLFGATIFLSSCASRYGSKMEAGDAMSEFVLKARSIEVIDYPTNQELEDFKKRELERQFGYCKKYQENYDSTINNPNYSTQDRRDWMKRINQCFSEVYSEADDMAEAVLFRRVSERTRRCSLESELNQWVCREWKVKGDEISKDKWEAIKPYYSYFRY